MEIEFDRLAKCYFMKFEKILEYWGQDPATFDVLREGEELFYKQLVLCCGVTEQTIFNIMTYSLVCETNDLESRPEPFEVKATLNFHGFDHDMSLKELKCDRCNQTKCRHVAAVLVFLNRHDISILPDIVGKDLAAVRVKVMREFYGDDDDLEDEEEEEKVEEFFVFEGRTYDNANGVPPRERFHLRHIEACDKYEAEKRAQGEDVSGDSEDD